MNSFMRALGIHKTFPLLVASATAISCDPLPTPVSAVQRYGVQARLVDASTQAPIQKRPLRLTVDRAKFERKTSRDGRVSAPAERHHYWTWLGGPVFASTNRAEIRIDCEGYRPLDLKWPMKHPARKEPKRGVAELGDVLLQRR